MTYYTRCGKFPAEMTETIRPTYKTRAMQAVEAEHGEPIDTLLRRLYLTDCRTQPEIAELLGLDQGTVSRWMRECGIAVPVLGPRRRRVA